MKSAALMAGFWLHPTENADSKLNGAVLSICWRIGPDEATRSHILVNNPAALYWFG